VRAFVLGLEARFQAALIGLIEGISSFDAPPTRIDFA
jgi:hypothetical protein